MPKADGKTIQERFNERYTIDPVTGCWNWTAGKNSHGYACIYPGGKDRKAQAYAYELSYVWKYGPVPKGLELDHECRNRACVNPDHLKAKTHRDNAMNSDINIVAINARKTECPKGHPYNKANTLLYKGSRRCRACLKLWDAADYKKKTDAKKLAGTYLPPSGQRTTCRRGHGYTAENTSYAKDGSRKCKQCVREWSRESKQRQPKRKVG